MKRLYFFAITLVLTLTLAACGGRQAAAPPEELLPAEQQDALSALEDQVAALEQEAAERAATQEAAEPSPEDAAEQETETLNARRDEQIRAYLDDMTLEEKVGQLFFVRCAEPDMAAKIAQYHLGGVLLFGPDFKDANGEWLTKEQLVDKLESYQTAAQNDTGIPLFIGSDEEGGTVTRASRNPNLFDKKLPSPQELYAAGGLKGLLSETMQYNAALLTLGINVNFAPVCDVSTDPNDFIYARSFGKNAAETMAYAAGVVTVMGDAGMGSVLKHFPGYGNNVDTHTGIAIDERPIETFRGSDFLPFRAGIEAGKKIRPFVLVSHNIVRCMDADLPASLSPAVHELLREELGFDGVVLTDDLAMDAVKAYADGGSVAVTALQAGNDMIVTTDFEAQIAQVLDAVADGTLDESAIDEACARVLRAKATRFVMPWEWEKEGAA